MIDLEFAKTVSRPLMQSGPVPDLGVNLQTLSEQSLGVLENYTGLKVENVPKAELLSREDWVDMNLRASQPLFDLIDAKLEEANQKKMVTPSPSLLQSFSKIASGMLVSSEIGLIFGFMSQKVLGQVEAAIFLPSGEPLRLVFVGENLKKSAELMGVDEKEFYHWVVLHELTHVYQFAGVPWLKPYLSGLMTEYLEEAKGQLSGNGFKMPNLAEVQQKLKEGGVPALISSPEQQAHMKKVQATMALIEGYAEHVMDATGDMVLNDYKALRDNMQARRGNRKGGIEGLIFKLLGMDMKMRQYEDGRRFCNHIVEKYSIQTLNQVWEKEENLPEDEEISNPDLWVQRVGQKAVVSKEEKLQDAVAKLESKPVEVPQKVQEVNPEKPGKVSKLQERVQAAEDEEYLVYLIKDEKDADTEAEIGPWIEKALQKGYIVKDESGYTVVAEGYQRLSDILKKGFKR